MKEMTIAEAARILDPETSRDALWKYEDEDERLAACNEACRIAVELLRETTKRLTERDEHDSVRLRRMLRFDVAGAMEYALNRLAAYEDTGITPEEIKELAQARDDGWLAVLPCKVGASVYDISDGTAYETRVLSFSYYGDHWACRTVSSYPDLTEFGTRIFLTREEAEEALTKRRGDNG